MNNNQLQARNEKASSRDSTIDSLFTRNLGWLTSDEQRTIASVRVGILGVGGVGGQYAELLARTGVTQFVIWDPDTFSAENTNRQNECRTSNYGKSKAEVIAKLILDINPNATVQCFAQSIQTQHLEQFCQSIDFYFDGLDFFAIDIRIEVFRCLRKHDVPAVTVAPVGTGASCLVFNKSSMSFDDYFGLHTSTDHVERSILFLSGLTPTLMQRSYLVAKQYTRFSDHRVPSLGIGVTSAASLATTTFLKAVLKRGTIRPAPWSFHFDPYLEKTRHRYTWLGYRNPIQWLKRLIIRQTLKKN